MLTELPRAARLLSRLIPSGDRESILGDLLEDAGFRDLAGARRALWLTGECAAIAGGLYAPARAGLAGGAAGPRSRRRARRRRPRPAARRAPDGRDLPRGAVLRIGGHARLGRRGAGGQLAVGVGVLERLRQFAVRRLMTVIRRRLSSPSELSSCELDVADSPRVHRQRGHLLPRVPLKADHQPARARIRPRPRSVSMSDGAGSVSPLQQQAVDPLAVIVKRRLAPPRCSRRRRSRRSPRRASVTGARAEDAARRPSARAGAGARHGELDPPRTTSATRRASVAGDDRARVAQERHRRVLRRETA